MATYNYGGKTYSQKELDAIAQKATPDQREAMNKQFGTAYPRATPAGQIIDANHPTQSALVKTPTPTTTAKIYNYNGTTYTQAQLDELAKTATPNQREMLNQQFGTSYARAESTFSGDANANKSTNTPAGNTGTNQNQNTPLLNTIDTQNAFESGYAQYIKAQEDAYGIETARNMQNYANQSSDAATNIQRTRDDYAKYTGQEIQDTARTLALNSTEFARSLTNASRAYGQRGILGAGIQKASLGEGVGQFGENQGYFKTLSQRRLDTAGTNMNRAETDYTTGASRLETQKGQYVGDRAAGLQVLNTQLQQQGDTLYNQSQVQNVQLKQQIADQAAIDKLYGRTPQNRPIGMRIGGKYTY